TLTTSTFATGSGVQAVAVGDGDGDGQNEILVGDDQWGEVHGYSPTGTQLWYVNNPEHGVSGMAAGDIDGDGTSEVLWGAGATSSGTDALFVGNPATHAVEWTTPDLDGPFSAATADLDRDGDMEFIILTYSSDSGYDPGMLEVHDLQGNVLASFLATNSYYDTPLMAVGQLDSDPALEIVILDNYYYGSRVRVFDGVTYALDWSSPEPSYSTPGISSYALIVRNIDGDPVDEIILATTDDKIQVLNGASPIVQGATPALDADIQSMAIADLDGDGVLDLVASTYTGFYIFRTSDLSERVHTTLSSGVTKVAATDGEFAIATIVSGSQTLISYSGSTLLEIWRCTTAPSATTPLALGYVTLAGTKWLASTDVSTFQLFPSGESACPNKAAAEHALSEMYRISFNDINGDGAPELIAGTANGAEIDLITLSSIERGDADNDGVRTDDDMDAIARLFFGDGKIPAAGADVNGDTSLGADDLFYLINYRRGTGAAPPQ
ncbi:MAG TPA: FG-GAP-like repeat-containing protein, partial [Thermoanaerobaculia bacterium]